MVFKCSLCSSFASTTYKGVLRHLGTVHAHDAGFHVMCASPDCPQTYNNFHSYKMHLYRKHREILLDSVQHADGEDDDDPAGDTSRDVGSPHLSNNAIAPAVINTRKREAALFTLKAKHIHKISQRSLNGVLCDFTTMLQSTVDHLEAEVVAVIRTGSVNHQMMQQVHTIFNSPVVSDPFAGLTTEYFYNEEFQLVVSDVHTCMCTCICTCTVRYCITGSC